MLNLDKKNLIKITFLVSVFALVFAYFVEYVLGYQPCNLCLIERIPYLLALIIIIINYKFNSKLIVVLTPIHRKNREKIVKIYQKSKNLIICK